MCAAITPHGDFSMDELPEAMTQSPASVLNKLDCMLYLMKPILHIQTGFGDRQNDFCMRKIGFGMRQNGFAQGKTEFAKGQNGFGDRHFHSYIRQTQSCNRQTDYSHR